MLADIFITFKNRRFIFEESFKSFVDNTPRELYRLTVVCDDGIVPDFIMTDDRVDHVLMHRENLGLGPSINQAISHIDTINSYYDDSRLADINRVSEFICYCQDDLLYTENWLQTLVRFYLMFEHNKNLGFASGVECIEHPMKEMIGEFNGKNLITKDWIRAAQMLARRSYWMSMFPIPRFDPETGRVRAKPNDGMGSGVDWWFIRNHEKSVCKSGKTCLVVPGLVKHLGYRDSTWLDREMPESADDKKAITGHYLDEHSRLSQEIQDDEW